MKRRILQMRNPEMPCSRCDLSLLANTQIPQAVQGIRMVWPCLAQGPSNAFPCISSASCQRPSSRKPSATFFMLPSNAVLRISSASWHRPCSQGIRSKDALQAFRSFFAHLLSFCGQGRSKKAKVEIPEPTKFVAESS